jgi:hypothetical protein
MQSMKNDNPPGLLSRRMYRIGNGKVVVEEHWNIDTPGCPMIRNPWMLGIDKIGPQVVRQIEMTEEEYQDSMRD